MDYQLLAGGADRTVGSESEGLLNNRITVEITICRLFRCRIDAEFAGEPAPCLTSLNRPDQA